ncbi:cytochrome P450 [Aspergillus bertholletiae]|uniref:Cytochrome P450 n=1 Tax=Aspergillus bertholletiae TaxID=1226010 RepID=A0A5N7BIK3_9EURO|nr:cytochrome P450 [Aspergillus bertholletiae]
MDQLYQHTDFASVSLLAALSIPPILYLLYHLIFFPLLRCDLRSIPGPAVARLTDLYRLFLVRTGSVHEHQIEQRKKSGSDNLENKGQERDFLARFLDIQEKHSDIPDTWIISWCQQNVQAGSDSTAITLTSILYHLLKSPDTMDSLMEELDNANLPSPVPWDIAHKLPYLDACIKEALRMTPAVGIPLERVAPAEGIELCGKYFGGGTVLGVSAWVVHRDQEVYGADAAFWRPGRWIEVSPGKRKEMERALFAFGGGSRVCLGKAISYLEMYKVVPELLGRFKFDLTNPQREWSLKNGLFTYTKGVEVTIQRRQKVGTGKH